MIDRASARQAARKRAAVALQLCRAALSPRILVASDDDGMSVLPEVEDTGILRHRIGQVFLDGKVSVRVGSRADEILQFFDHV